MTLCLGFLASKNGSSLRAIIEAIEADELAAEAALVVSNNRGAEALAFAEAHGVPTQVIPTLPDPTVADGRLAAALEAAGVDLVILSGYLRPIGPAVLARYRNRILNVHPGLLPAFGGAGMYGRRVHEAVIAAGAAESGVTIHLVDEVYDHGATLLEWRTPIAPGETADTLEARIRAAEPGLFVQYLSRLTTGKDELPPGIDSARI